ncbi:hypothetical protein MK805_01705 [Shimazuella sp. AN120528]|uniref:hypothetical protein n=1 Tax=Shimazuella soli TaxID=1892854 RepID=UPI001F0FC74C|nr:hypothetical protein [Shimazuella soli]MCH5583687.1 hypothetical protein [Shimazuella soli]
MTHSELDGAANTVTTRIFLAMCLGQCSLRNPREQQDDSGSCGGSPISPNGKGVVCKKADCGM